MAEFLEVDSLYLNGFDGTLAESVSPYAIDSGAIDLSPAQRNYEWTETGYSAGSAMVGDAQVGNVERSWPLQVRARFTSGYTNLVTNPRPYSVVTGWSSQGTGSTVTLASYQTETVIQAVTTGSANSGMKTSFTGTVASYSAGVWVKVSSGTAPIDVKFDSIAGTSVTATTTWQLVKTEGKTLTAAGRELHILQTDTGSRTIYVKLAGVVLNSTYPGYLDGACGDARWNGTAHASTSTALTGQNAINLAYDSLAELGEKAIYNSNVESSETGGTGLVGYWTPRGSTMGRTLLTVKAVDVDGVSYGYDHHNNNIARSAVRLVCHPYAMGPETVVATGSKPAGAPALVTTITGVDGAVKGPARITLTAGSSQDQRLAMFGLQGRDYVSGASLIIRGPSLGTSGYSGSSTAHTNEVQTLTPSGTISGGTYTLALDGKTTSAIAYDANAATIQAALEALANVDTNDIAVTGGPLSSGTITFTFSGTNLTGCNVSQIVYTGSVTGGGSASMATTTAGVPGYISSGLYDEWTTICDTGNLTHVGSYRVLARVYDNASTSDLYTARVRLTWGLGDLTSITTNDSVVPSAVADYSLVDLGQIHIPTVATGTQRWKGKIEGKTSGTAGNTLRIVDVMFVPLETGAGQIGIVPNDAQTIALSDDFNQSAGSYTGKSMDLGGTVSGGGDADDFTTTYTGPGPYYALVRTAVSDTANTGRYVYAGPSITDSRVTAYVYTTDDPSAGDRLAVMARWVDSSNFAIAGFHTLVGVTAQYQPIVYKKVGGTFSVLGTGPVVTDLFSATPVDFTVRSDGSWTLLAGGASVSGNDSVFATGGTLASGKCGLYDERQTSNSASRFYDNFRAYTLPAPIAAIYKSQDLQFRPNGDVLREDSTGAGVYTLLGNATISHLPELTPSGSLGITNRGLFLTSRNNPDLASDPLRDALDVSISQRPVFALARSST